MTPESTLYRSLRRYLERRGYLVGERVRPRSGSPREFDVVGVKRLTHETATIEAKMGHFPEAYRQALFRLLVSDYVYLGFPSSYARMAAVKYASPIRAAGLGVLGVDGNRVKALVRPRESTQVDYARRDALIEMVFAHSSHER